MKLIILELLRFSTAELLILYDRAIVLSSYCLTIPVIIGFIFQKYKLGLSLDY